MGRARRWLKALLGMKKEKDPLELPNSTTNTTRPGDRKEKRRWSFGKSLKDASPISHVPANLPPNVSPADSAWLRSYLAETEKEQNKHAIAVAAATAAAADAAVAAAHAAVAVVRLTSKGGCGGDLFGKRERWAAMRIQTVFRGYLARKAHRALRGLVKLQALVRGFLVRKRAAATLHGMQALIRAQTSVRYQRARRSFNKENRFLPESRPRKSIERFDEARSEFYSKRLSATYEPSLNGLDENPKIVEIDTFRTRSRSRRYNTVLSEYGEDVPYTSSPLPCPIPTRITVPGGQQLQDYEWYFTADECKFTTAHSTPRLASSFRSNAPSTPAKSVCGDSFFQPYSNCPNYMSSTKSFKAKSRSHSAPKQRPEPLPRKRLSLDEIMAARNSVSGIRMHRPYNQVQEEVLNY